MKDSGMWRNFWTAVWRANEDLDRIHNAMIVRWARNGFRQCSGSGWLIDDLVELADAEEQASIGELLAEIAA